jgi:hypothetical protein
MVRRGEHDEAIARLKLSLERKFFIRIVAMTMCSFRLGVWSLSLVLELHRSQNIGHLASLKTENP